MRFHGLGATCVVAGLLVMGRGTPGPMARQSEQAIFSVRSEVVVLHVSVTDRRGVYVPDLPRSAFAIYEDGQPQQTQFFAPEDEPATVGLIIDGSGSMWAERVRVIAAAAAFAETSHPGDELFAIVFNEHSYPALPPDKPFTNDPDALRAALADAFRSYGRTALHDAIAEGLAYLERGAHRRKVLVVVSDGADNASMLAFPDVVMFTQTSNTVIYGVGLIDPAMDGGNPGQLRKLAQTSGGLWISPRDISGVATALARISADIRHTYTLGYTPAVEGEAGRFREIRVAVTPPDGHKVVVRTRHGYASGR